MLEKRFAGVMAAVFFFLCLPALAGCTEKKSGEAVAGLQIDKNGRIISHIVEAFDKDYYTIEGLEAMIQKETAEYNAQKPEAVTFQSAELSGEGDIVVTMQFASAEDYRAFNGSVLFYGTIAQAKEEGFSLDTEVVSVSDGTKKLGKADMEAMPDSHILIVDESVQISLPDKVLYMTEGTELLNGKSIRAGQEAKMTYVIIK